MNQYRDLVAPEVTLKDTSSTPNGLKTEKKFSFRTQGRGG